VNSWWWVAIGLVAWCGVAVVIGLCIGPVLSRSSRVRESLDQQWTKGSTGHEPTRDDQSAPEKQLSTGAAATGEAGGDGESVPEPRHASGPAIARQRDPSTSKRNSTTSPSLPTQSLPSMRA
jgi:hypothetical protein